MFQYMYSISVTNFFPKYVHVW